jgi:HAD superfamily hydrolase (TIGR01509 family)
VPLIIFDCDGVLVDSETLENEIMAQCLSEVGWVMSGPEAQQRFIGFAMKTVVAQAEAHLGKALPEGWIKQYHARSHAQLATQVEAIEGVSEAIDRIEMMGWTTAVASSGEHAKMKITLGRTGLYERFEGRIFSAEDVANGKPAPDVYLLAAKSLGQAPETCFAVEDSPNGVRAAVAAGMYTFGYEAQIDPALLTAAGANEVFFNMSDLPTFLKWAVQA